MKIKAILTITVNYEVINENDLDLIESNLLNLAEFGATSRAYCDNMQNTKVLSYQTNVIVEDFATIVGAWPGNESDNQIENALKNNTLNIKKD